MFGHLRLHEGEGTGGDAGGGGGNSVEPGGQPGVGGEGGSGQDKQEGILNPFAPPANNGDGGTGGQEGGNRAVSDGGTGDPNNSAVDAYIQGLDFSNGADMNAMLEAAQNGDGQAFMGELTKMLGGVYKQALVDGMRANKSELERNRQESVSAAAANMNFDRAQLELEKEFPAFGNEAMQPVLKAALTGFMKQHQGDTKKAVGDTRKYLQQMIQAAARDMGMSSPTRRDPANPFAAAGPGEANPFAPGKQDTDWNAFLGAIENNDT